MAGFGGVTLLAVGLTGLDASDDFLAVPDGDFGTREAGRRVAERLTGAAASDMSDIAGIPGDPPPAEPWSLLITPPSSASTGTRKGLIAVGTCPRSGYAWSRHRHAAAHPAGQLQDLLRVG